MGTLMLILTRSPFFFLSKTKLSPRLIPRPLRGDISPTPPIMFVRLLGAIAKSVGEALALGVSFEGLEEITVVWEGGGGESGIRVVG